jgi:hypothetical protein
MSASLNSEIEYSSTLSIKNSLEVTVAIITYNGINVIPLCLKSIF